MVRKDVADVVVVAAVVVAVVADAVGIDFEYHIAAFWMGMLLAFAMLH